jgi:hypothetical protein
MTQEKQSDDVFFEKYTCEDNPNTEEGSFGNCFFDTYGPDIVYVVNTAITSPKRIWTIIDDNDGWYGIVAGYRYINRQGYLITEQEWKDEYEQYTITEENTGQ